MLELAPGEEEFQLSGVRPVRSAVCAFAGVGQSCDYIVGHVMPTCLASHDVIQAASAGYLADRKK